MSGYIEKFWRDATAADVARVMAGEVVEARFRDLDREDWSKPATLKGWTADGKKWLGFCTWNCCQVYDPPQWFIDKPDPGEGFRLLAKEPDEAKLPTDEYFAPNCRQWIQVQGDNGIQKPELWYRRRIEQPKPEPKYAVGQRVRVVKPKQKTAQNGGSDIDEFFGYADIVASVRENGGKFISYVLEGIDDRDFPEDYLEPVVEPEPKHYTLQVGETVEFPDGAIVEALEKGILIK